jgi:predicted GNAT family acetyltransferase
MSGVPTRSLADRLFRNQVRQLTPLERADLVALLAVEPGYSVFLRGNLEAFGLSSDLVQFWGAYARGRLTGALMMVERRAALYALPGADFTALGRLAGEQCAEFVMGRADLVDAVLRENPQLGIDQREDHYLAGLAFQDFRPAPSLRSSAAIRRAGIGDVGALTRLYLGAEGFESMTAEQIARVMQGRVTLLRTYLAESDTDIVAAASTSAEARSAAMIGGVWTGPAHRNQGLSTAVVAALSHELLEEGCAPYLFYRVDNAPAARVYTRIGYRAIGRWTVVYFDRRDSA